MKDKKPPPLVVRQTLLDRIVGRISPAAGVRRYSARVAHAHLLRAYDGASKGRGTDGWTTSNKAADAEIGPAQALLRDRMRDLVRNNPTAAKATSSLITHMVGVGIRPRAKTGNPDKDKLINDLFEEWSKQCDADGRTDFYGQQALALRLMIEGGESVTLQRPRRRQDGLKVPLQIQIIEGDHIDSSKNQTTDDGGTIRYGIQYDVIGRRKAYWLFPDHPGDLNPIIGRSMASAPVDARRVIHLFERQRTQSRGVPWGTPALRHLRDIDDWANAELVRKKMEACQVGIVFGSGEEDSQLAPVVEDADGNKVEQFEPGMIGYARNGKSIQFNTPGSTPSVREWNSVMDHRVAAAYRVPYELITGDLREVNFSSARISMDDFRMLVEMIQWLLLIPVFCLPIWNWFCAFAYLNGQIDSPTVPVEWDPPEFQSVNPFQDAQTDLLEVRAGFASPQEKIAKRGRDPGTVLAETIEWNKLLDADGVVTDADPRRTTKGGQGQGPVAYDPETGEPISTIDAKPAALPAGDKPAPGEKLQ